MTVTDPAVELGALTERSLVGAASLAKGRPEIWFALDSPLERQSGANSSQKWILTHIGA